MIPPKYRGGAESASDAENTEAEAEAENTGSGKYGSGKYGNVREHTKYTFLTQALNATCKISYQKLFTTETKTNGYHTLHYHHSNFTTILPSVPFFCLFR